MNTAVITTGRDYPDALAVAPYAAKNGYPLLFTDKNNLPDATIEALIAWEIDHVHIIGGQGVISDTVTEHLKEMGININRIHGSNRFETAVEIVNYFHQGKKDHYYIATGLNFADALTGSVLAAKKESPVFLTRPAGLPSLVRDRIKSFEGHPFVLGGEGAVYVEVYDQLMQLQ